MLYSYDTTSRPKVVARARSRCGSLLNGPRSLEDYAAREEELRLRVERHELVRRAFRRPFEMWLATEYGLFLEEKGYQVDLRTLCDRAHTITPHNIAIIIVAHSL